MESAAANFEFDDGSGAPCGAFATSTAAIVCVPRGVDRKQDLFAQYVRQLTLPDYFGWNWDALEECLRDLSWLEPGRAVIITHAGLPLRGRSRATYLSLLAEVANHWRGSQVRSMRIVFPCAAARRVAAIVDSAGR